MSELERVARELVACLTEAARVAGELRAAAGQARSYASVAASGSARLPGLQRVAAMFQSAARDCDAGAERIEEARRDAIGWARSVAGGGSGGRSADSAGGSGLGGSGSGRSGGGSGGEGAVVGPAQTPPDAAPYEQAVADQVPPYGTKGEKTTGIAVLADGQVLPPQDSGYDGPALRLPKPRRGMDRTLVTHVEAHTVAAMRERGATSGTLYINRVPCEYPHPGSGRPWGCENALERMLRPGEKLTVYGPDGYVRVFRGRA